MKVAYSYDSGLHRADNARLSPEEMRESAPVTALPNNSEDVFVRLLRNKITRLMTQLKEYKSVIQQQEAELQKLRAEKQPLPDYAASCEEGTVFTAAVLKRKHDSSALMASSLRDCLRKARAENTELSNQLANQIQRSEIAQRSESIARCEADSLSQKLEATSTYLKAKLSEQDREMETAMITIRRETEDEIAKMRNKFLDAEGSAASAMAKAKHAEALVDELSQSLVSKEKELNDHLASESTLLAELRAEIAREKAQREEAVTKAETVGMRLHDMKSTSSQRIHHLEDQLIESQERIDQLTGDLLKSKTEQDHLSWQLTIAENQTLRLRTELQVVAKRYEEELRGVTAEREAREAQLLSSLEAIRLDSQKKVSEAELLLRKHREINDQIRCQLLTEVEHSDHHLSSVSEQQESLRNAVLSAQLESRRATDLVQQLQQESGEQLLHSEHLQGLVVALERQLQQRNYFVARLEEEVAEARENTGCLVDEVAFLRGCLRKQGLSFDNGLAARNVAKSTAVDMLVKRYASESQSK